MKKYVIVSTYPEKGSKNIGDYLITHSLISSVRDHKGECVEFSIIWRAAAWEEVRDTVMGADLVIFACLAIRPRMHEVEYPYLSKVLDSGIPYAVIAAGTDLDVHFDSGELYSSFSPETLSLLERINLGACVFTTRGYLSQSFCAHHNLFNAKFSGDIAFYDTSRCELKFEPWRPIRKIVISDPHKGGVYAKSLSLLYRGLVGIFPDSEIVVAAHGENKELKKFSSDHGVPVIDIYRDKESGLEIYSSADLHVGFRVHAHVSALSRRRYSYLLEQDGRGCDYGLTLDRKISVPGYVSIKHGIELGGVRALRRKEVSLASVKLLLSLVENDSAQGFSKFMGLEVQLQAFVKSLCEAIKALP
ncbi:polysaccharide pyruvyl transferase family protein [Pseudomonas sp. ALS1131]|nr:polysaccharide pyruvyl transferase family protein [Pseudomonas sp. ALS1131]TRO42104.1 polysaccharide pyruvyl transferase family protein [Pseudomonas sp. ALS1131]